MQLEKGERSIFGYFPSSNKAQQAAKALIEAGIPVEPGAIQIDRIGRFSVVNNAEYNNPINAAVTVSGPTLYSASEGDDGASPLLAADPSASGIGNPDAGAAGGHAFLVTLVTREENVNQAVEIMKAHDGEV